MMKNRTHYINFFIFAAFTIIFCSGCEKHEIAEKELHGGSGIWEMESYEETEYDTTGKIINQKLYENPGRFVFFSSDGIDKLSGYKQGLFILYADPYDIAYGLSWYTNKSVFIIRYYGGPLGLNRTYTVLKSGGKDQVWEHLLLHDQGTCSYSIKKRVLIKIREVKMS